jgi:ribonuclease R
MTKKPKIKGRKLDQDELQQVLRRFFRRQEQKAFNARQAIRQLKMDNDRNSVQHAIEQLVAQKILLPVSEDKYRWAQESVPDPGNAKPAGKAPAKKSAPDRRDRDGAEKGRKAFRVETGRADLTRSGAAFIQVAGLERDIFIPPHAVNTAMQGDSVEVRFATNRRGRPEGEVVRIIKRLNDHFIGTLRHTRRGGVVVPDKQNMPFDILIEQEDLGDAGDGEKVVVHITDWPGPGSKSKNPRGRITGRFEDQSLNDVEMQAILVHNGFPLHFSVEALTDTRNLDVAISEDDIARRRDFRDILTITIDPEDAKDFDDALSYRLLDDGGCEIGIHIADVTHYVRPGTALDQEAFERATSVYLVDRVLPMLPERISNELCSLRPNETSLTFSAVFTFDNKDKLTGRWFGKTAIHSDRRFSYEEAQSILESGVGDHAEVLGHLNRIATKLRMQRFKQGSIAFESEEVKFRLNEDGVPVEVYVKERKETHLLVEDFMLLANREVATFMQKKNQGQEIPFVYRVHDLPDPDKLNDFALFANELGFKMSLRTPKQVAESFNQLAQAAKTNENLKVLEPLAIRTMAKAVYTTDNIGHYGLGFEDYTHFTSPIRRYSDVLVHRILERNLIGVHREEKTQLESRCRHVSERERRAADAERESIKYKQVEFIEKHVGEVFEGQISGMMDRGVFVQLKGSMVEGMAPFSHFPEPYVVDDSRLKARGQYSKHVLKMGDTVQVQILFADLARRQVEMRVILE